MAHIPGRAILSLFSLPKRCWFSKCRNIVLKIKISCIVLICALIPFNIMFYTRGCHHTTMFFNPNRPDSFRHGHPPKIPDHFFTEPEFGQAALGRAVHLLDAPVAPIVHFIWCSSGYFEFQHYLSVLNAFKFLRPTSIHFHYAGLLPQLDADGYYQFFMDLKRDMPNLIMESVSSRACSDDLNTKLNFVMQLLNNDGGIFIGDGIVLAESLPDFRKRSFSIAVNGNSLDVLMMEQGFLDTRTSRPDARQLLTEHEDSKFTCKPHVSYRQGDSPCVFVSTQVFPVDIWELSSDFGRLARWAAYGKSDILKLNPSNVTVIPNIVHYVWLGDRTLSYFGYLSLLSALYVLNAETVYIHGDKEPNGPYWEKMKNHKRVAFVSRDFPGGVFAEPIIKFASHASDFWRGDLLIRYGGVYMDWDVLWVNSIPEELRRYDAVACPDFPKTGAFPDVFNMGVLLAAQGSRYLQYFLESYHNYLDNNWSYNAIHMPYKVYEKHPDLLQVDRHLQVICAKGMCHPTWNPNFKDYSVSHLNSAAFDWKRETLAMHWTYPDPKEFADEESLTESVTMFASIAKYVLRKAENKLEKDLA